MMMLMALVRELNTLSLLGRGTRGYHPDFNDDDDGDDDGGDDDDESDDDDDGVHHVLADTTAPSASFTFSSSSLTCTSLI